MKITGYSTNKLGTNSYLIENEGKAIIIDPCVKYDYIIGKTSSEIVAVVITHAHFDHIDQLKTYLNKDLDFYMHENAYHKLQDSKGNLSHMTGFPFEFDLENEKVMFIKDYDHFNLIGKEISFMYLPGHSNCSIALVIDEHMFLGDVVFRGSVGRYDLPTSNYSDLIDSINRLKNLKKNYYIYSGHGPKTDLEFEKKNNPFFR